MTDRATYIVQTAQGRDVTGWEVKLESASKASDTGLREGDAEDRAFELAEKKWRDRGIPAEVEKRGLDGEFDWREPVGAVRD